MRTSRGQKLRRNARKQRSTDQNALQPPVTKLVVILVIVAVGIDILSALDLSLAAPVQQRYDDWDRRVRVL